MTDESQTDGCQCESRLHNDKRSRGLSKWAIHASILGLLGIGVVVADWWSVMPRGSDAPKIMLQRLFLLSMIAMTLASSMWWLEVLRSLKSIATNVTIFGLGFLIVFLIASAVGRSIRFDAFCEVANRGNTIVVAIREYVRDKNTAPVTLTDLVPEYLDSVPATGLGAYPKYHYRWDTARDEWKLWVPFESGISRGSIVFLSKGNYPEWWEPIGEWALSTHGL